MKFFIVALCSVLAMSAQASSPEQTAKNIHMVLAQLVGLPTDCAPGQCQITGEGLYCKQSKDGKATSCGIQDSNKKSHYFSDEPARYLFLALQQAGLSPDALNTLSVKRVSCIRRGNGQEIPLAHSCELTVGVN